MLIQLCQLNEQIRVIITQIYPVQTCSYRLMQELYVRFSFQVNMNLKSELGCLVPQKHIIYYGSKVSTTMNRARCCILK